MKRPRRLISRGKLGDPIQGFGLLPENAYTVPMVAVVLALVLSQPTYTHSTVVEKHDDGYPKRTQVVVRQVGGKPLWSRTFEGDPAIKWSPNRRALAIFHDEGLLTTWLAGDRVRKHDIFKSMDFYGEALFRNSLAWSPDNRRILLIWPGTQGAMSLGQGNLIVIHPITGRGQDLGQAERAVWIGNRRVRYWGRHYDEGPKVTPFGPINKRVK